MVLLAAYALKIQIVRDAIAVNVRIRNGVRIGRVQTRDPLRIVMPVMKFAGKVCFQR